MVAQVQDLKKTLSELEGETHPQYEKIIAGYKLVINLTEKLGEINCILVRLGHSGKVG